MEIGIISRYLCDTCFPSTAMIGFNKCTIVIIWDFVFKSCSMPSCLMQVSYAEEGVSFKVFHLRCFIQGVSFRRVFHLGGCVI